MSHASHPITFPSVIILSPTKTSTANSKPKILHQNYRREEMATEKPTAGSTSPSAPATRAGSSSVASSEGSPVSAGFSASVGSSASATAAEPVVSRSVVGIIGSKMQLAEKLLLELQDPNRRENALLELCRKRESFNDFGLLLWHSFGTMAILLQEVISVYPFLSPPTLTSEQSNRACNTLSLLQCVASHPGTRRLFIKAHIPLYLYSFLTIDCKSKPFEYLKLTCLGVLGALVKEDDTEVISFLLATEIMPLCLGTIETASGLSKMVATYIMLKLLQDSAGLGYVCVAPDRFYAVGRALRNIVVGMAEQPSPRLLKHIINCYIRISEDTRGRMALRESLPEILTDGTYASLLDGDPMLKRLLQQLLLNVHGSLPVLQGCLHVFAHRAAFILNIYIMRDVRWRWYSLHYIDGDAFHPSIVTIAARRAMMSSVILGKEGTSFIYTFGYDEC